MTNGEKYKTAKERELRESFGMTITADNTKTLANALAEIDRLRGELRYIAEATANASNAVRHIHEVAERALKKAAWESEANNAHRD